jgi:hypothetical protein
MTMTMMMLMTRMMMMMMILYVFTTRQQPVRPGLIVVIHAERTTQHIPSRCHAARLP